MTKQNYIPQVLILDPEAHRIHNATFSEHPLSFEQYVNFMLWGMCDDKSTIHEIIPCNDGKTIVVIFHLLVESPDIQD